MPRFSHATICAVSATTCRAYVISKKTPRSHHATPYGPPEPPLLWQIVTLVLVLKLGAPLLEEPQDFLDLIQEKVKPTQGRELQTQLIDAVYDWSSWFGTLGIQISGITSTHARSEVNHCWRFVRRGDLPSYVAANPESGAASWSLDVSFPDCPCLHHCVVVALSS